LASSVSCDALGSYSDACSNRTVVIGMGNLLLTDEGVGIHVIQALMEKDVDSQSDLLIIDGGTCPDVLSLLPEGVDKLILIDAVKSGGSPGSIYRFTPYDISFNQEIILSIHQLDVLEGLKMMKFSNVNPKDIVIIGIEPKELHWGLEISPELADRIPYIVEMVMDEISN
jgi:hydrogenase maturation protease